MKRAVHALAWVALATAAFVLWPQSFGGSMTYVITRGNSMEPGFVAGDLAVLRTSDDYAVGDVLAYDSEELEEIVMHRAVRESAGGLVLRGDNNDFDDPETVTDDQVLGELLIRVPGAGRVLAWIAQPVNLGLVLVGLFLLFGDRAKPAPAKDAPGRLVLRSLQLPERCTTAEVATPADLERLAGHYDRPVLQVEGDEQLYVLDGAVVYTWAPAARSNERRPSPHGRDWAYDRRHLVAVPGPRSAPDGVDVSAS